MRVRHPYSLTDDGPDPDGRVHYGGRREMADVDEDGTFEIPDDRRDWLERYAARYDCQVSDLLVSDGADSPESDSGGEMTDGLGESGQLCGYYDPDTMRKPCGRDAGWGTDRDTGHCRDHVEDDDG